MTTKTFKHNQYIALLVVDNKKQCYIRWFIFENESLTEIEKWDNKDIALNHLLSIVTDYCHFHNYTLWKY